MKMSEYGTTEYYSEMFSDILADVGSGLPEEPKDATAIRLLKAFEMAIISWLDYHDDASSRYRELHRRFLTGDLD